MPFGAGTNPKVRGGNPGLQLRQGRGYHRGLWGWGGVVSIGKDSCLCKMDDFVVIVVVVWWEGLSGVKRSEDEGAELWDVAFL